MKVYPYYFYDHLGGWEFDANTWTDKIAPIEIPDEVLERYKEATEEYIAACEAVREYI